MTNQKRTLKQRIKFIVGTTLLTATLPVIALVGLSTIIDSTKNPKWISDSKYMRVTMEDLANDPKFYEGKLVAITDGEIQMNLYLHQKDVNTFYKKFFDFDDSINYVNMTTIHTSGENNKNVPISLGCEFFSDLHTQDYHLVNKIMGKYYQGKMVLKGKIKKISYSDGKTPMVLKSIQISQDGKTKNLEDTLTPVEEGYHIQLKGYTIDLDDKSYYLGDMK